MSLAEVDGRISRFETLMREREKEREREKKRKKGKDNRKPVSGWTW
jgi:hypothetical protein